MRIPEDSAGAGLKSRPRIIARIADRGALFPLMMLFLCSCAPIATGRFDSLADSSNTVLQGTTDTYTHIERLERHYMVFNPNGTRLTAESFVPEITSAAPHPSCKLTGLVSPPEPDP